MVNEQEQHSGRKAADQGVRDVIPEPNKISASTPYDPVTLCYTSLSL
jgi:hypothetical protein